ncbi:unnamed protein product [Ectocarpus sp. 12 AP-2014]
MVSLGVFSPLRYATYVRLSMVKASDSGSHMRCSTVASPITEVEGSRRFHEDLSDCPLVAPRLHPSRSSTPTSRQQPDPQHHNNLQQQQTTGRFLNERFKPYWETHERFKLPIHGRHQVR